MNTLTLLRSINVVSWSIIAVWFSPSVFRYLTGWSSSIKPVNDGVWSVYWFMSVIQIGFGARFFLGWTLQILYGAAFISNVGLQIMLISLSFAIMKVRYNYEGWHL